MMPAPVLPRVLLFGDPAGLLHQLSVLGAYELKRRPATDTEAAVTTSWIQLAVVGEYESPVYGKFAITPQDLARMEENFRLGRHPVPPTRIPVDYNHGSMSPRTPEEGKAAGWFVELALREQGTELWGLVEWTDDAAEAIKAKEYQFVSPTFHRKFKDHQGHELGCTLLAAAITNHPFLQGMAELSLASWLAGVGMPPPGRPAVHALAEFPFAERGCRVQEALNRQFGTHPDGFPRAWLIDLYDDYVVYSRDNRRFRCDYTLTENGEVTLDMATEREVVVSYTPLSRSGPGGDMKVIKLTDAQGKPVEIAEEALEQTEVVKALRAQLPGHDAVVLAKTEHTAMVDQLQSLSATVDSVKAENAAIRQDMARREANAAVDALLAANKITPAQRDVYVDLALNHQETFTKLSATLQPTAGPVRDVEHGSGGEGATGGLSRIDAAAREIQQQNPKLTLEQATEIALSRNPKLYDEYCAAE